jgi:anti-sigma regulatory factor (Ser/Thr protein kinase)
MDQILIRHGGQRQAGFRIGEPSEIAAARRAGSDLARKLDFDDTLAGRVALVITEAATNIAKHAGHGEILLRVVMHADVPGIEILAIDAGPGMANVAFNMEDGNSTAGTYGVGLGAIQRQSSEFNVYSAPGLGTVLCMLIWKGPLGDSMPRCRVGAVCLPIAGEHECGDAWSAVESDGCLSTLVADGLGHGPLAAEASRAAVDVVEQRPGSLPADMLHDIHAALRRTRGAAVAFARIDFHAGELRFAGVGNIAASVHQNGARQHLVSHNGIVGSNMRKVQEFTLPWQADSLLVMHSDGINTRWDLDRYPGLTNCEPSLVAAVLYRDFARLRDDVSVIVVREH